LYGCKPQLLTTGKQVLFNGGVSTSENPIEALREAIEHAGSQAALAAEIGLKQQHIWNWLNRPGSVIPAEYCPAIERATGVLCERLRPDVAWAVLRKGRIKTPRGAQRRTGPEDRRDGVDPRGTGKPKSKAKPKASA